MSDCFDDFLLYLIHVHDYFRSSLELAVIVRDVYNVVDSTTDSQLALKLALKIDIVIIFVYLFFYV